MEELLNKFDECLGTWSDLPDYVYSSEYRNAFIEFAKKRVNLGCELKPGLAIMTLHHETDNREPYFNFDRLGGKNE